MHLCSSVVPSFSIRSLIRCSIMICASGLFMGCMTNRSPRFHYGPDGEKIQFKRYEANLALDLVHHQTRIVYELCEAEPHDPLYSQEQKDILMKMGKPDYVREDYATDSNEYATDWVYVEKDRIYQFIVGELVYEGPVTDYERTLIKRGRPEEVLSMEEGRGPRVDIFTYKAVFTQEMDVFRFSNGKLAGRGQAN